MVRINLINPESLADQHLIAEYNEILMLMAFIRKHQIRKEKLPEEYRLGQGHMLFFKNKVRYLKNRHERIRKEMKKRGFHTGKTIKIRGINKKLVNGWRPKKKDKQIIKKRLIEKINLKPDFYRYYKKKKPKSFFIKKIKKAD